MSRAVPTKFVENETGIEVDVVSFFHWNGYERICSITYPSGRTYAMPDAEMIKYFTIVRPQEVFIEAFGGIDERPTVKQAVLRHLPAPTREGLADHFDAELAKIAEKRVAALDARSAETEAS
jgi:hypothetical protein